MALTRPFGKNTSVALFSKETVEGTFVAPTQSHHTFSEGVKYTPQMIEDPSNIGSLFTTDLVKTGYNVEGSVEMKAHPYFIGDALFFALGKSDAPVNPVQGFLLIWYTGSANYSRIRKSTTTITAETSSDGVTWAADSAFGTTGVYTPGSAVLSAVASAIDAFVGYNAKYVGYASSPISNLADWSNVTMKSNGVKTGACIQPYLVSSTIAKMHSIYADPTALTDIPSFSAAIDMQFGTAKDISLAGCKVSSLGIKASLKNMVDLSVGIKAMVQSNVYTYAAAAVPASKAFATNAARIFIDSMLTQETKELSININNNFYTDEAIGVDTFNAQGRQGASIEVSGSANLTVTDGTDEESIILQSRMQADTPVEIIAYFEGTDYADLANNAKYSFLIRMRSVKLTDCSPVISGPDRLTLPIAGKAVASTFGRHIDVWVTNQRLTAY